MRVLPPGVAAAFVLAAATSASAAVPSDLEIRRSAEGTPHIRAESYESLGYGFARAHAEDNLCLLADQYLTVRAERSRHFGPDAGYPLRNTGTAPNNLNSDFFWQRIIDEGTVERLAAQKPPAGPVDELHDVVRGYTKGYNDFIAEEFDSYEDPACKGAEWVKPIEEIDVMRRFYQLSMLASKMAALDGIGGAQPPIPPLTGAENADALEAAAAVQPGEVDRRLEKIAVGSNAVALGREATANGRGLLLGNPHQPWQGTERFYQSHLTIPGEIDVSGASLYGSPIINIGFTQNLAWSHTVSTARRFAIVELTLVPGSPTTYLRDGVPTEMKRTRVSVMARGEGGELEKRTRTLYATEHGPVLTSLVGLPLFPWSPAKAYAMFDANGENFGRLINHFYLVNKAQSVDELDRILRRYLGVPWVNTIAADREGNAYYADIGSVPGVPDEKIATCSSALGVVLDRAQRVQVLDGSRTTCDPDTDPSAPGTGILPASAQPSLKRGDYVTNSNDSHWLSNPHEPLEGFPRIIGEERTQRSLRTRNGLFMVERELAGEGRFTQQDLQDLLFGNEIHSAELWQDELVQYCRDNPTVPSSAGPTDAREACDVIEDWSGRDDRDARGALLWRRFATRALAARTSPYDEPFDVERPVETPRGLNTLNPEVPLALGDAIRDLRSAGIALDAELGEYFYEDRGERIPLHGGNSALGSFNVVQTTWNPKLPGYTNVQAGGTYIQVVEFNDDPRCPLSAKTALGHGLATDPTSPWFNHSTKLFSREEWVEQPFCTSDVAQRTQPVLGEGAAD